MRVESWRGKDYRIGGGEARGAGGVASPSLLSSDSKRGAGGGGLPRTAPNRPGSVNSGAVRVCTPSQNFSPKVKHLFGRRYRYMAILVTLVTSIKFFYQNAGNALNFPPTIQ